MNKSISEEQSFMRIFLNQLDTSTKSNILDILNEFTSNVLSIFSTILSFSVDDDIKCFIISIIFTNLGGPIKYYTSVNNKWMPFCASFGKTCNYLLKFNAQDNIMKTIINYFMTTKMDQSVNIMCISKSFVALILFNKSEYVCAKFTFLTYDRNTDKISMCVFDGLTVCCCKGPRTNIHGYLSRDEPCFYKHNKPRYALFDLNNMYICDVIYCPDESAHKLTKIHEHQLINKIIKLLSNTFDHLKHMVDHLFY